MDTNTIAVIVLLCVALGALVIWKDEWLDDGEGDD